MYQLAVPDASFDAVVIHQVLHYADRPAAAIAEAARVLRPNGILVLVDFAPHALEFLRDEHAHRRLGFSDTEVAEWCRAAGLDPTLPRHLPGDPLTVVIWTAHRRAPINPRFAQTLHPATPAALVEGELH
jgi:ArsR family transcriptional regulator